MVRNVSIFEDHTPTSTPCSSAPPQPSLNRVPPQHLSLRPGSEQLLHRAAAPCGCCWPAAWRWPCRRSPTCWRTVNYRGQRRPPCPSTNGLNLVGKRARAGCAAQVTVFGRRPGEQGLPAGVAESGQGGGGLRTGLLSGS